MKPLLLFVALCCSVSGAQGGELGKIDRTIKKEPPYKGKPAYCLLVFGPEAKKPTWPVSDGDVLYVARNGNGDLTDDGERIQGKRGEVTRSGADRPRTEF